MSVEYEITVPDWDQFQVYKQGTIWIRTYCRLLSDRDYVRLSFAQRGLLQSIWLEYARANHGHPVSDTRALRGDTAELSRQFGQRVLSSQLEALNHAGFIQLNSRPALEEVQSNSGPEEKRREENYVDKGSRGVSLPGDVEGFHSAGAVVSDFLSHLEQRRSA